MLGRHGASTWWRHSAAHPHPRPPAPHAVSRAEAGQQKRLLLLDRSAGWEVAEELNLDVGPRYFAAAAVPAARPSAEAAEAAAAGAAEAGEEAAADAAGGEAGAAAGAGPEAAAAAAEAAAAPEFDLQLPEGLRPGDRLLLTLPVAAAKQHAKQLRKLEKQGGWVGGGQANGIGG